MDAVRTQRLRGPKKELLFHHLIVGMLSYVVYTQQAFQFYGPIFMGVSELSSLPLAFLDLFKYFPTLRASFPVANEIVRNVFAASFLVLRGFYWPFISISFWRTALDCLAAGDPTVSAGVVYIYLATNILTTSLQWYWSSIILKAIYFKIIDDPRHKEA